MMFLARGFIGRQLSYIYRRHAYIRQLAEKVFGIGTMPFERSYVPKKCVHDLPSLRVEFKVRCSAYAPFRGHSRKEDTRFLRICNSPFPMNKQQQQVRNKFKCFLWSRKSPVVLSLR